MLLLVGCNKEPVSSVPEDALFKISTESFGGNGSKMVMTSRTEASWEAGDEININGTPASVSITGSGEAYIDQSVGSEIAPIDGVYRAVFPNDFYQSTSGENVTIAFPAQYTFHPNSGHQEVRIPMMARSTGHDLNFSNLTAGILLHVTNNCTMGAYGNYKSNILEITSVCIKSNKYRLQGEWTVDAAHIDNIAPIELSGDDLENERNVVRMAFLSVGETKEQLKGNGASKDYFIPVPIVGDGNQFEVHVHALIKDESSNNNDISITFDQKQTKTMSLGRNELAYVPVVIDQDMVSTDATDLTFSEDRSTVYIASLAGFKLAAQHVSQATAVSAGETPWRQKTLILRKDLDFDEDAMVGFENFEGVFDGKNHRLSNLDLYGYKASSTGYLTSDTTSTYFGLFYNLSGTVKNLILDGVEWHYLTSSSGNSNVTNHNLFASTHVPMCAYVGALCSYSNGATIENCHIINGFNSSSSTKHPTQTNLKTSNQRPNTNAYIGGLVGRTASNTTITGCTVNGITRMEMKNSTYSSTKYYATSYAGGLIGYAGGNVSVSNTKVGTTSGGRVEIISGGGTNTFNKVYGAKSASATVTSSTAEGNDFGGVGTNFKFYLSNVEKTYGEQ